MANGIIDNGTRADEFRTRIPDKMVLNEANKIFITDGTTDSVNNKSIPHVVGKNIIEAVDGAGPWQMQRTLLMLIMQQMWC